MIIHSLVSEKLTTSTCIFRNTLCIDPRNSIGPCFQGLCEDTPENDEWVIADVTARVKKSPAEVSNFSDNRITSESLRLNFSFGRVVEETHESYVSFTNKAHCKILLTQHANDVPLSSRLPSVAIQVMQATWYMVPLDGDGQQSGSPQLDGNQHVEHRDDRHRQHEEQYGRDFESVLDQRPPGGTPGAVQDDGAVIAVLVSDAELNRLGHCEAKCQQPDHHHELHCP